MTPPPESAAPVWVRAADALAVTFLCLGLFTLVFGGVELFLGPLPIRIHSPSRLLFLAAKGLKYWAITALGPRWTFRVLVPPGSTATRTGPYQWVDHPNYIAVAGELLGAALAMHAAIAGPIAVTAFSLLMIKRVGIEERALEGARR